MKKPNKITVTITHELAPSHQRVMITMLKTILFSLEDFWKGKSKKLFKIDII